MHSQTVGPRKPQNLAEACSLIRSIYARVTGKDIDDCPILALPGNPMAAAVSFTLIGRWLIAQLSGDASIRPAPLVFARSVLTKGGYLQVLAARLAPSADGTTAEPLEIQGSASLMALAGAQGLILLPDDRTSFAAGDRVEFVLI